MAAAAGARRGCRCAPGMAAAEPRRAEARAMAARPNRRSLCPITAVHPQEPFMRRMIASVLIVAIAVLARPAIVAMTATPAIGIKLATLAPAGTSYDLILKQMGETWRKATGGAVNLR